MERELQEEEDDDFALALQLQELWEADGEASAVACIEAPPDPASLSPLSVVDEAWELLDPSPDVYGLFVQFNETLFWGRLAAVEVSWSPRMTLYGRWGRGREVGLGAHRPRCGVSAPSSAGG
ncbi:sprT-like domain-containing protein Spartan, partial [Meleagris gallopavo]|uniref:sprT-like domain-containing protein Spartan n=1 Tax=Meleagris gallopavo TaxID=9103 RepID=UPI00093C7C2A